AYHAIHFSETPRENYYAFLGKAPNKDEDYPKPLDPVDDLPPVTVITHVREVDGKLTARGTTSDNGVVKRVLVNGREGQALAPNFAEWQVVLEDAGSGDIKLAAHAEDAAGNIEKTPHVLSVRLPR